MVPKGVTSHDKPQGSAFEQANQAALKRETEIRSLLDTIVSTYAPGGSYQKGMEAMLERQKQQYLGSATQNLISSGLYGSTMTAGLPGKFEEEIGMPTRAKLEDVRTQAYTGALGQKAGFIERIEDITPSFETIANLTARAQQPESSLSDWLAQNFGSVPNASVTQPTSTGGMSLAELQKKKEERAAKMASYPTLSSLYGNTEAARDARQKAGYYLGSDGTLHKL